MLWSNSSSAFTKEKSLKLGPRKCWIYGAARAPQKMDKAKWKSLFGEFNTVTAAPLDQILSKPNVHIKKSERERAPPTDCKLFIGIK